jgi:tRNA-binding protein
MPASSLTYDDFLKVDIRLGKIVDVQDFPEARKPAFKLKIDFGPEIGIKSSSVQAVGAHTRDELTGMLVCCVVNFPPKKVGPFTSEVLTLGFRNAAGPGWVLITAGKPIAELGGRLS